MGGKDNYKIREAKREFVYVVLRMMIAKAGFEGILRNQTLVERFAVHRHMNYQRQTPELRKSSHGLENQGILKRNPGVTMLQHQERPVITTRQVCYLPAGQPTGQKAAFYT